MNNITTLPQFCAHEHWGSIGSFNPSDGEFRADMVRGLTPYRRTGIIDILVDPYFGGCLIWSGLENINALMQEPPLEAMEILHPAIENQRMTGAYQCIRRGIKTLYGFEIDGDERTIIALDSAIAANYERVFDWYQECMNKAHFSAVIRPVHPVYYIREESPESAAAESAFIRTVMRIDPLLDMWQTESPTRDELSKVLGIEPVDAKSWKEFIGRVFNLAQQQGAVGIKQLQAYHRRIEFTPVDDSDVTWTGDLTPDQVTIFQDWIVHECCRQANDRHWPHQVHVGTHNLPGSSPLALADLATRYPNMKIVQLHCWPYINEAGWLAKHHPNVYIDACWLPILNPRFLNQAWNTWLNYVPTHKLMCSNDATTVEMAAGSSLFVRETLADALTECTKRFGMPEDDLESVAARVLHGNAAEVYGVDGDER